MNLKRCLTQIALLLSAVLIAACGPQSGSPQGTDKPVADYESLVSNLRAAGATVETAGEISQDFFSVQGRIIKVNGAEVQVFEYENETAAGEQAGLVSATGSPIGTTMVTWMATPHFYRSGRLIALYVGDDDAVLALLKGAMGPQFAGG